MNWKKIVAREWLVLMGCVIAGLALIATDAPGEIILVIYGFVQVVRATIWAIKTIRRP